MEEEIYCDEAYFGEQGHEVNTAEEAKEHPHNCTGIIYATKGGKPIVGTGFLIASDLVLTAAHNVVSQQGAKYADIRFYPGVSGPLEE